MVFLYNSIYYPFGDSPTRLKERKQLTALELFLLLLRALRDANSIRREDSRSFLLPRFKEKIKNSYRKESERENAIFKNNFHSSVFISELFMEMVFDISARKRALKRRMLTRRWYFYAMWRRWQGVEQRMSSRSVHHHDSRGKKYRNRYSFCCFYIASALVHRSLTFKRSVQQGIAAKMSNEYMVPIRSADPSHFSAQKLERRLKEMMRKFSSREM